MKGLDFFIKKTVICILGGALCCFVSPPSFGQSESEPSEQRECTLQIETILQAVSEKQPGKLRATLHFEEGFSAREAELYLYEKWGDSAAPMGVIVGRQGAEGILFEKDFNVEVSGGWPTEAIAILEYTRPDGKRVSAYVGLPSTPSTVSLTSADFTEEVEWVKRLVGWSANNIENQPFVSELSNERGVSFLVFSLEHGSENLIRMHAAYALQQIGLKQIGPTAVNAVPALIRALREDSDFYVRKQAAFALGIVGRSVRSAAVPALAEALADPDNNIREIAARSLIVVGATVEATPALITALADSNPDIRRPVISSLARIGPAAGETAVIALARVLKEDSDLDVRRGAAFALGDTGSASINTAVPALITTLTDSDWLLRVNAARALGQIGPAAGNAAVSALIGALTDSDSGVRDMAARALREMGASAIQALSALNTVALTDSDPDVRNSAGRAIATIRDEEKKQSQGQKSLRRRPKKSDIFIETFDCKEDIGDPRCKRPQAR